MLAVSPREVESSQKIIIHLTETRKIVNGCKVIETQRDQNSPFCWEQAAVENQEPSQKPAAWFF
jgi:N12 class adenine-specific DNA methylase